MGVIMVHGMLPGDHVNMLVENSPYVWSAQFERRTKSRSSRKFQQEFERIRKGY